MIISRKLVVKGLVQGVGFRYFAQRIAAKHQVRGYVRNLQNGSVETLAQGSEISVEAFMRDLIAGPRHSRVDDIEEIVLDLDETYTSFRIEK